MSLNDKLLAELDKIENEAGFSGRSEVIRAGLRLLMQERKEKSKMKGRIDAVLLVIHHDKYSEEVSAIRHKYQSLIKTQVHNHVENHRCLEVFILHGDANAVLKLEEEFQTNRKMELVRLITA